MNDNLIAFTLIKDWMNRNIFKYQFLSNKKKNFKQNDFSEAKLLKEVPHNFKLGQHNKNHNVWKMKPTKFQYLTHYQCNFLLS